MAANNQIKSLKIKIKRLEEELLVYKNHHRSCTLTPEIPCPPSSPIAVDEDYAQREESSLQVIQFNPHLTQTTRNSLQQPGKWRTWIDRLIKDTPPAEEWPKMWKARGLAYPRSINKAFSLPESTGAQYIEPADIPVDFMPKNNDGLSALVQRAVRYSSAMKAFDTTAQLVANLAAYQELVFASFCWLLLKEGASKELIASLLRYVSRGRLSGTEMPKSYQRLLSGAKYVNGLVKKLSCSGWGNHANELLLFCEAFVGSR